LSSLMEPSAQAAIAPPDAFGLREAQLAIWNALKLGGSLLLGPRRGEWLPAVGESVHRMVRCETAASLLERVRIDGILADRLAPKLGWLTQRALAPTQGRVS